MCDFQELMDKIECLRSVRDQCLFCSYVDKKANKKNIRPVPSAQSDLHCFLLFTFEPMGVGSEDLYQLFMSLQKVGVEQCPNSNPCSARIVCK